MHSFVRILCNTEDSQNQAGSLQHSAQVYEFETLVMVVGPRFVLPEFSVFTNTKLESSDFETSDLPKTVSVRVRGRNAKYIG